jgi:quercetin dioxygenase-like cupin family protein
VRYSFRKSVAGSILFSKKSIALMATVVAASVMTTVGVAGLWNTAPAQDATSLRMRVIHFTAGNFDSGWHYHPGLTIVQVTKGALTYTSGSCIPKTYAAGETFIEIPYHPSLVTGTGDIAMTVTSITSSADPLTVPIGGKSPCP